MQRPTRSRLFELSIAAALFIGALFWAERAAWKQITSLRREIDADQVNQFRAADEFRMKLLETHEAWRRALEGTSGWDASRWEVRQRELATLLKDQAAQTSGAAERKRLASIRTALDVYSRTSAEALRIPQGTPEQESLRLQALSELDGLLSQTRKLGELNRASTRTLLADASAALTRLQRFLLAGMLGLLLAGGAMVALAYRRTIAPLRSTLTESRGIIERQEKLASLGVLATGIAHEIRNPLTAIKVRLFTLRSSGSPSSEHEDLEVIESEIDRLEHIVRDFLQFARPTEPEFQTLPVGTILRGVGDLLTSELARKSIQLEIEILANDPVRVDPGKIKQVLINFIHNGAESIEGPGVVRLRSRASREVVRDRTIPAVIIDIADNGKGMPPDVQRRLFDPFFTTKEKGTGLGLPLSARIIELHGGVIQYQTAPEFGTTFSIILPRAPDHATG